MKTVYVDLYPTRSLSDFARALAAAVVESVESPTEKVLKTVLSFARGFRPTMTIDRVSGQPKFSFDINVANAQSSLESILEYLRSRKGRTVVAIDEFQQIAEYPEKGVEALLRSKIQFMHNVGFVFSGSRLHMMAEMFHSPKRPFFNSTAAMSLGVIDRQAYFRFAASFFRKAGRILPEETFRAAYDRFDGITWYVQSVMKALYASEIARPTEKDVADAIDHLAEENAMNYGFILSKCTPGAVELLRAVAAERVVSEPMSAEFGRRHGLRAASSVRFALDSLLGDELLYKRDDGYVVYDRLFAEWLRN
jgi:AAA+ ATPase superfamily predicted ATPase